MFKSEDQHTHHDQGHFGYTIKVQKFEKVSRDHNKK